MKLVSLPGGQLRHHQPAASIPSLIPLNIASRSCPRSQLKLATLWTPILFYLLHLVTSQSLPRKLPSWLTMSISIESFLKNSSKTSWELRWNSELMLAWCKRRCKHFQMSAQILNDWFLKPRSLSKDLAEASSLVWKCAVCITFKWNLKRQDWTML